jgi:hypothetical protein
MWGKLNQWLGHYLAAAVLILHVLDDKFMRRLKREEEPKVC